MTATLARWPGDGPPSEGTLDRLVRDEGLTPRWWSNGPGDRYGAHDHPYDKVVYCASGSIRFDMDAGSFELTAGDRLDIPAGTRHSAVVGSAGVSCLEAARSG